MFALRSHLFEKMRIGSADSQHLFKVMKFYNESAGKRSADFGYIGDINDDAPVDLPEFFRIQLCCEFLDRFSD